MPKINDLRDRMIVALDVPTVREAYHLITELGDAASFYKIGYRLAFAGGLFQALLLFRQGVLDMGQVIGFFGLFGSPRGPLAGVFLIPLGMPWILMPFL